MILLLAKNLRRTVDCILWLSSFSGIADSFFSSVMQEEAKKNEIGGRDLGDAAKFRVKRRLKAWTTLKMFHQISVL